MARGIAAALALVAASSCMASASGIPFRDTGGRSCRFGHEEPFVTCDVDPASLVTCGRGRPGYVLDAAPGAGDAHHDCAGCFEGTAVTIDYTTCEAIVCDGDVDCPLTNYRCQGGICVLR